MNDNYIALSNKKCMSEISLMQQCGGKISFYDGLDCLLNTG